MGKQAPAKRKTTALPAEWKGLSSEALDVPSEVPITPKKVLKEVGKEEKKTPEKSYQLVPWKATLMCSALSECRTTQM